MTKTEAAQILARSATRAGAQDHLTAHLSELACTVDADSLLAVALRTAPALATIRRAL